MSSIRRHHDRHHHWSCILHSHCSCTTCDHFSLFFLSHQDTGGRTCLVHSSGLYAPSAPTHQTQQLCCLCETQRCIVICILLVIVSKVEQPHLFQYIFASLFFSSDFYFFAAGLADDAAGFAEAEALAAGGEDAAAAGAPGLAAAAAAATWNAWGLCTTLRRNYEKKKIKNQRNETNGIKPYVLLES